MRWHLLRECLPECAEVVGIKAIEPHKEKVKCPHCGYPVNVMKTQDARCKGIFLKCKNKDCKKEFELKI